MSDEDTNQAAVNQDPNKPAETKQGDPAKALHQERERRRAAERRAAELASQLASQPAAPAVPAVADMLKDKEPGEFLEAGEVGELLAERERQLSAMFEQRLQQEIGRRDADRQRQQDFIDMVMDYDVFNRDGEAGEVAQAVLERELRNASANGQTPDLNTVVKEAARKAEAALIATDAAASTSPTRPAPTPDPTPGAAEAAAMRTPKEHPEGVTMRQLTSEAKKRAGAIFEQALAKVRAGA